MSGDKLIMSDDWTEIEDQIFRQNLKVKFEKGWWNSSLQVLTSNFQPSKKFLEQKIKNSSRKNSRRQNAFHEWWKNFHESWHARVQTLLVPRLVMSGEKFIMSGDTRAGHFFWVVSNGSFCIKNISNGSFSLRGFIFYQEQSWNKKRKLSKHI